MNNECRLVRSDKRCCVLKEARRGEAFTGKPCRLLTKCQIIRTLCVMQSNLTNKKRQEQCRVERKKGWVRKEKIPNSGGGLVVMWCARIWLRLRLSAKHQEEKSRERQTSAYHEYQTKVQRISRNITALDDCVLHGAAILRRNIYCDARPTGDWEEDESGGCAGTTSTTSGASAGGQWRTLPRGVKRRESLSHWKLAWLFFLLELHSHGMSVSDLVLTSNWSVDTRVEKTVVIRTQFATPVLWIGKWS